LFLENGFNPIRERASRVEQWLKTAPVWKPLDPSSLQARVVELMAFGLKNFDALHIGSVEQAGATLLATVDDRLASAAALHADSIRTPVRPVLECIKELPT
jgi:hypothetical protein